MYQKARSYERRSLKDLMDPAVDQVLPSSVDVIHSINSWTGFTFPFTLEAWRLIRPISFVSSDDFLRSGVGNLRTSLTCSRPLSCMVFDLLGICWDKWPTTLRYLVFISRRFEPTNILVDILVELCHSNRVLHFHSTFNIPASISLQNPQQPSTLGNQLPLIEKPRCFVFSHRNYNQNSSVYLSTCTDFQCSCMKQVPNSKWSIIH